MDVRALLAPATGQEWDRMEVAQSSDAGVSHHTFASSCEQYSEADTMELAWEPQGADGHGGAGGADTHSFEHNVSCGDFTQYSAAEGHWGDEWAVEDGDQADGEEVSEPPLDRNILSAYHSDAALEATEQEWDEYAAWLEGIGVQPRCKEMRMWHDRVPTSRMAVYLHFARLGVHMELLQEQHVDSALGWSKRGRACPDAHWIQVPLFQSSTNMHFNTAFTAFWWLDPTASVLPLRKCRMDLYTKVSLCHVSETVPSETVHPRKKSVPKDTVDVDRAVRSIGGFIKKKVMRKSKRAAKQRRASAAPTYRVWSPERTCAAPSVDLPSPVRATHHHSSEPNSPESADEADEQQSQPQPQLQPQPQPQPQPHGHAQAQQAHAEEEDAAAWCHVLQKYDWDCGIACVEMVLRGFGYQQPPMDLRSILNTDSVWTIHLAHLLHDLHVPSTYLTQSLHGNEAHHANPFYSDGNENLHEELHGVSSLFASANAKGMAVHERVLSLPEIAKLILDGHVSIVVVDSRHLVCSQCGHEKQRGANRHFAGHYILLTGFNTASCEFEYMDPATRHTKCVVSAVDLDRARKSEGTEFDTLVVWNEQVLDG